VPRWARCPQGLEREQAEARAAREADQRASDGGKQVASMRTDALTVTELRTQLRVLVDDLAAQAAGRDDRSGR
jgi:hypothetical protein